MIVYQYDNNGFYMGSCDDYGGPMPNNCQTDAPPPLPWGKQWAKRKQTGQGWDMVDDHRARRVGEGFAPEHVQEATDYWLPPPYGEDAYGSTARHMTEIGPLPSGAVLSSPKQSLDELKSQKRQALAAIFATIEQRAQRPQSAVLAALIDAAPVPEPDADYIWQLEEVKATNRTLLAQLEACTDVESAQQIEPWLPPVSGATPSAASRLHSSATQNLYGTDNAHLPA